MAVTIPPYAGQRLAQWLRDALTGRAVEHLPPVERVSVPTQLQHLSFRDFEFADRLKDAIGIAVTEWQPPHGLALLASLARCAGYVKASNVIVPLDSILRSGRIDPWLDIADQREHIKTIIGVIGAFGSPSARLSLENLFVERRFRTRFPSMLVTGLVKSDPENYTRYVEALLEMADDGEIKVNLFSVTAEIVRLAGPATIIRQLRHLRAPWHYTFCELLGGNAQSPGRWVSRGAYVLQLAPERYAPVEYMPDDNQLTNDITMLIEERIDREGGMAGLMVLVKAKAEG